MKRKVFSLLIALLLLLSSQGISFANNSEIKVFIDGHQISFDVAPQLINDRTMVPMRTIFEAFNASVDWDNDTQTVIATTSGKTVQLTIGSGVADINGDSIALDAPATIIDGRTFVPLRFVGEALDSEVNWYPEISLVSIYTDLSLKNMITMYDLWATPYKVEAKLVNEYWNLGWSENISEVQTNVFSVYNGVKAVGKAEVDQYLNEGWTLTPPSLSFLSDPSGFFEKNSVDGIEVFWGAKNTSGKIINYYTIHYTFINSVGDLAYDEITHKSTKTIKTVGPVPPNKCILNASIIGYVPICHYVRVDTIDLEYDDGSTETIWCGQIIENASGMSTSEQLRILEKINP